MPAWLKKLGLSWSQIKSLFESEGAKNKAYDSDVDGVLDEAAIPSLPRSKITDFFSSPFWDNIPDKPAAYPPDSHQHDDADLLSIDWSKILNKPSIGYSIIQLVTNGAWNYTVIGGSGWFNGKSFNLSNYNGKMVSVHASMNMRSVNGNEVGVRLVLIAKRGRGGYTSIISNEVYTTSTTSVSVQVGFPTFYILYNPSSFYGLRFQYYLSVSGETASFNHVYIDLYAGDFVW